MAKKDHKVEIWTTSGDKKTEMVNKEDVRYYDDLPFNSSNVSATRITVPKK